jgi:hypothetical protein
VTEIVYAITSRGMCSDGTQKKIDPAKGKSCLPWPGPLQRICNLDSGAACARQVCSECDHEQQRKMKNRSFEDLPAAAKAMPVKPKTAARLRELLGDQAAGFDL